MGRRITPWYTPTPEVVWAGLHAYVATGRNGDTRAILAYSHPGDPKADFSRDRVLHTSDQPCMDVSEALNMLEGLIVLARRQLELASDL